MEDSLDDESRSRGGENRVGVLMGDGPSRGGGMKGIRGGEANCLGDRAVESILALCWREAARGEGTGELLKFGVERGLLAEARVGWKVLGLYGGRGAKVACDVPSSSIGAK